MTITIEVVSINIGLPKNVPFQNKEVATGIYKDPVTVPIMLTQTNFAGDGQADRVHHGGPDKAVCVYAFEHYPYWEQELGQKLRFGAFGENLTIQGLLENQVCIGDTFRLGGAIVQVSQPRQPCFKIGVKYGDSAMPLKVQHTGYTGFYFRVLQEGVVSPGDDLVRLERHPQALTVAANDVMHNGLDGAEGLGRLLAVDALSESWRNTLTKRLDGMQTDASERLTGQ